MVCGLIYIAKKEHIKPWHQASERGRGRGHSYRISVLSWQRKKRKSDGNLIPSEEERRRGDGQAMELQRGEEDGFRIKDLLPVEGKKKRLRLAERGGKEGGVYSMGKNRRGAEGLSEEKE